MLLERVTRMQHKHVFDCHWCGICCGLLSRQRTSMVSRRMFEFEPGYDQMGGVLSAQLMSIAHTIAVDP
jgi:hypothetical protein